MALHPNTTPTLADIIAKVQQGNLAPLQIRDRVSALYTAARLFEADPAAIPADPSTLRSRFALVSPAMAGMSRARLANVRSLVLAALREAGITVMRSRSVTKLSPPWKELRVRLPGVQSRVGLSRVMNFCSLRGIVPASVNATTFEAFQQALEHQSLVGKPASTYRTTCVLWNRAVTEIEGWPAYQATIPVSSRRYAASWNDFLESFQTDVQGFLHHSGNRDVLDDSYAPSVRASTVNMRRKQILQLATALTHSGFPVEQLTDLSVLTQAPNGRLILNFLLDRTGRKPTKYLHQQAQLLVTLARHWVKADTKTVEQLQDLCRRVVVKATGMTEKNRVRLRQFDNPANVQALLNLPYRVLQEVDQQRDDDNETGARRVMLALVVLLMTAAPLRIDNLAGLEIGRHVIRSRARGRSTVHIVIPGEETKNGLPYDAELRDDVVAFLATYLDRYHSRLAPGGSSYLFPTQAGARRSTVAFSKAISQFVLRETGICMNAHLFRHLAVKLYLEVRPEDIETARRILGHRSINTTTRSYMEIRTASSFRRFDEVIASLRKPTPLSGRGTKARGKRA